ncbi:MAG: hypothetical protein ABSH41_21785 [Syntrophobacteraceae bacterium]
MEVPFHPELEFKGKELESCLATLDPGDSSRVLATLNEEGVRFSSG